MKTVKHNETVKLDDVQYFHHVNPRTRGKTQAELDRRLDRADLRQSLAEIGQQTPLELVTWTNGEMPFKGTKKGELYLAQGTTRTFNMKILAAQGVIDPLTGKPFETVKANIHENLSEAEVSLLVNDHSHRGLTKDEVFIVYEQLRNQGRIDKDISAMIRPQLDNCGFKQPGDEVRKVIDGPDVAAAKDRYYKFRKGTLDIWSKAVTGPEVLRDFFYKVLKTGKGPADINNRVEYFWKLYTEEQTADATGKITRKKPGPKFTEAWDKFLEEVKAAESENRPVKATGAMNREALGNLQKLTESRIMAYVSQITRRENGYTDEDIAPLGAACVAFENGNVSDGNRLLDELAEVAKSRQPAK